MPSSGAPTQPPTDGFEPWELDLCNRVVDSFLLGQRVFAWHERDDLVQECLAHWFHVRSRYRGVRNASISTYMRSVLRNKLSDLLETRTAAKRGGDLPALSLDRSLDGDDADGETLHDVIAGPADTERSIIKRELRNTARRLLDRLSPDERRLLLELLRDPSLLRASARLGVPRTTLGRQLDSIRKRARDDGLRELLE